MTQLAHAHRRSPRFSVCPLPLSIGPERRSALILLNASVHIEGRSSLTVALSEPRARSKPVSTNSCPALQMAEVYSWMTSQANATAKTTPSTGNPTRNARSSRRTGSWMRKNFGRGRLSTTAVSATKSSSFTSRPNSPRHSPNSRRRAPSQCRGSSASGHRRPVARPRRTRRIRVGLQHAPRSTRAVLGIKPCLNVAGVGDPAVG